MYVVENANAGTVSVRKHQQNPAVLPRQTFCMEDDPASVRPNPRLRRRPFGAQAIAVGLSTLPPSREDSTLVGIPTGPLYVLMVSRRSHPAGNLSTSPHLTTDPPPDTPSLPRNAADMFVLDILISVSTCCCLLCRILPACRAAKTC
ncbi:hypothetical protein CCHR01_16747 [Colletotrichum chrysophilum]|uniref:Uncharacterized protein n=1 Tax=Colletotrichum chrysophilum TaxID=1836956 RepID=A0AAD9A7X5_9PEZI|nr:hypothetical protein K456DRAFT_1272337 [Colletotrichum gloeosporioides 23]KAK1840634.1 hypothetical protein CCHR01_16747 [Colletotrichum chrysophilum]